MGVYVLSFEGRWGILFKSKNCHPPASNTLAGKLQPSLKKSQVLFKVLDHICLPLVGRTQVLLLKLRDFFTLLCRLWSRERPTWVSLRDSAEVECPATVNFRQVVSCFLFIQHSRCVCASTSLLQRLLFTQHDLQRLDPIIYCAIQEP